MRSSLAQSKIANVAYLRLTLSHHLRKKTIHLFKWKVVLLCKVGQTDYTTLTCEGKKGRPVKHLVGTVSHGVETSHTCTDPLKQKKGSQRKMKWLNYVISNGFYQWFPTFCSLQTPSQLTFAFKDRPPSMLWLSRAGPYIGCFCPGPARLTFLHSAALFSPRPPAPPPPPSEATLRHGRRKEIRLRLFPQRH